MERTITVNEEDIQALKDVIETILDGYCWNEPWYGGAYEAVKEKFTKIFGEEWYE